VGEIMPTVKLDRKVFDKLVGKKLSENELKERMAMIGTDLESVDDKEIVVEVFPNRPDMLSEQGFSRAFRSFLGIDAAMKEYTIKKSGYKVVVDANVTMRAYTACAIVKGLKLTDERIREIMQVQEKLAMTHGRKRKKSAYGLYPMESIHFPLRYVAKDPSKVMFQPLGFEQKIPADQVEELHPTGKKFGYVSKGWKKYPFFIDAKDNVMCMLPFTNSHDTGKIDLDTTAVFVECTGTDLSNVKIALNILVTMLADMDGEIYSLDVEYDTGVITTPDLATCPMELDLAYANKRLGLALTEKEAGACLQKMGYKVDGLKIGVPAYRADVLHQCDLVEDIAIAYGYENFEEEIPAVATIAQEDPFEVFKSRVANLLVGLGLLEVYNYHLIDKEMQTTLMNVELDVLEILDPVSEGYNSLRAWVLPSLLQSLKENRNHEYPQKLFEIGGVFKKDLTKDAHADEFVRLGVVLANPHANYTEARQIIDYLLKMLDLESDVVEDALGCFLDGRCGRVVLKNDVKVAYIGEVHPQVLENFGMEMPVCAFELNLTELWNVVKDK
jgi:phenylalanyl-tRNA synthetase beta chain